MDVCWRNCIFPTNETTLNSSRVNTKLRPLTLAERVSFEATWFGR